MKFKIVIIIYLFFADIHGIAYSNDFSYLRPKDGLMDSEINSIAQDNRGVMWFATWWGLISYDGFDFKEHRPEIGNPYSIPDKKTLFVFVDSDDNLWVASSSYLSRYDEVYDRFYTYNFDIGENDKIYILSVSEMDKNIIVQTVNGIYLLPKNKKLNAKYKLTNLSLSFVNDINTYYYIRYSISHNGKLYLASNNYTPNHSKIFEAKKIIFSKDDTILELEPLIQLKNKQINSIGYSNNEDKLYIATDKGVIVYSAKSKKMTKSTYFEGENIQKIICTSNNKVFCSSGAPEIYSINLHTGKTKRHIANPYVEGSILNSRVLSLFEDFSGNLWIGHQGQGISILNLHSKAFTSYKQDPFSTSPLQSNQVMCFHEAENEIFIGGRTGGLSILPKEQKNRIRPEFKLISQFDNGNIAPFETGVWDIEKQNENIYWAGTDAGLYKLEKINGKWFLEQFRNDPILNNPVRKIFIDKNKNIWCGLFNQGLLYIPNLENNPSKKYFVYSNNINDSTSLSDNVILTFKLDRKNRLWVGTTNGLNLLQGNYNHLDLSGNSRPEIRFKRYQSLEKKKYKLNNNEINCIYENNDGLLWIATQGGGINILNPETDTITYITRGDGLPSNDVQGILSDETGLLWISTTKGLVSYNQVNIPKFTYYHQSDGIQGDIFLINSYFKALDGEMFFGGDEGFTRFYPKEVNYNKIEPKILLTNLKFKNNIVQIGDTIYGKEILLKSINNTEKLVFDYKHKVFSIGVAAIHYQNPRGNWIIYKLDGYDKDWRKIPAYFGNVYYSNLPAGFYKLRIKAINSDNVISSAEKVIEIEVKPPWYFTWYVITIFIIITVATLVGIGFIVINRQRLIYETKIDKLKLDNAESKMKFLTNIAHGLKTPLSLVIAPTEDLIHNYKDIKKEWRDHLNLIHRNSNYLLKLINQIIDFRKLNSGKLKLNLKNTDLVELIREVVFNFKSFEDNKHIRIKLDIPFNSLIVNIDPQKIEEVLYNLISNAFKHTRENGQILVSLEETEKPTYLSKDFIKITVFNEGKIISEYDQVKIFERFYKIDEKNEGAGIGLSFSQSLVELHSGKIDVESIKDRGMAFHVLLPLNKADINRNSSINEQIEENHEVLNNYEQVAVADNENEIETPEDEKQLKVVLVEDNYELRAFLKNILSRQYACYDASDGQEGFKIIKDIIPDIIISDIIMPKMDGYQLCKQVKENLKTCHIPVILLSAKSSHEQIVKGYKVGADTYVTKPFDLEIISSQISRLIKNRELIKRKYQEQNFMVEVSTKELSKDDEFILNIREFLENNLSDANYNVKQIAEDLEVSTTQLYRKLKAITGHSPVEFLRIIRLQYAYKLINERKKSVKEVCYLSGFNNISYFIKCFKEHFGVTPAILRDNGENTHVTNNDTKHTKIQKI